MTSPRSNSSTPASAASGTGTAQPRLLAVLGQNRNVLLLGGGGLSFIVISLATLYYFLTAHEVVVRPPPKLSTALALLDAGQYIPAREAAEKIQAAGGMKPDEQGGPPYVIGATSLYEADETFDPGDRAQRYLVAARYLARAHDRGFPAGRETEGLYLLGRSLHETGSYAAAIAVLTELAEKSPALRPAAQRLLASCCLRSDPPQLDAAQQHGEAALAATNLTASEREAAQLLYGEILLARRDFVRCAEQVALVPNTSPLFSHAMLLRGRSLLDLAATRKIPKESATDDAHDDHTAAAQKIYVQAIDALRQAHSRRAGNQQVTREASYLIGVALRRSGNLPAAQAQFIRVRKSHYESPEAIAASIDEAEISAELGQGEAALEGYLRTLEQLRAAPSLVNPWLTDKQLVKRLEAAHQQMLDRHQFALAVRLAEGIAPPLSIEKSVALKAATHEQWGDHLEQASRHDATDRGIKQQAAARAQFRAAGDAVAQLSELHVTTRQYVDDLWHAGRNYARGRDFEQAVKFYRKYLAEESKRERPAVLVSLGEALISLDRTDEAMVAFNDCMAGFPKDPATYQARLLASRALVEKNDIPQAKAMLQTNLHHESLTPRSDVWRDSLFAMGTLLHDQGQAMMVEHQLNAGKQATPPPPTLEAAQAVLHEALRYLVEAVERYPNDQKSTLARFQIAEAHRQAARVPLTRLKTESIESRRAALSAEAQNELQAALEAYDELTTQLNRRADEAMLPPVEQAILRNSFFARGGVLYDLGRFEQAIQAYSTATNRYQSEPAAVEAYVQIASCYRRLNKPLEARGTLEQAKLVIERMPANANFTTTTRYGRDEWNSLLDWLSGT